MPQRRLAALAVLLATPVAGPALAQEGGTLTMGLSVSPSSFDPQLGALGSDETYYSHVYDALFMRSPNLQPVPKLATGYTLIDDLTWEIDLRQGVTFHDGSPFDADDVLFTLERLPTVEGSDGLNTEKMAPITNVEVLNPHKIRVTTDVPVPNFISQLFTIFILSNELDPGVTTAAFNSGKAAIGTGPYRFVEWRQGEEVVLEANADYFGDAPQFETVTLREMPNAGGRVAALLAGDVDFIDAVPPLDVGRLRDAPEVDVVSGPSARVIFIQLQSDPAPHPDVTDASGVPLDPNPLSMPDVRRALAASVDQALIADRIMDGLATPATQAVPAGFLGHADDVAEMDGDPMAMLADAGYPDGFALTLSCPNDRYVNDAAICQAVGQMFQPFGCRHDRRHHAPICLFRTDAGGRIRSLDAGMGQQPGPCGVRAAIGVPLWRIVERRHTDRAGRPDDRQLRRRDGHRRAGRGDGGGDATPRLGGGLHPPARAGRRRRVARGAGATR